jgi:acetyl esterase/lipase
VQDVAAAVAWVYENIRDYGGSNKKINLLGHSAGAHMATLLVVNNHFLDKYKIKASKIQGVIVVSGVFEIKTQEGGATPKYLGMVFGDDPKVWREASCQSYLYDKKKLPSFLVSWSSEENPLIISESTNFITSFRSQHSKLRTYVFPGRDHDVFQNELANTDSKFFELVINMVN